MKCERYESLYESNPVTGEKLIDWRQLNYKYEIYDYTAAALRRNRINPQERNLNTDVTGESRRGGDDFQGYCLCG